MGDEVWLDLNTSQGEVSGHFRVEGVRPRGHELALFVARVGDDRRGLIVYREQIRGVASIH